MSYHFKLKIFNKIRCRFRCQRILALDGGGVRGILPWFLEKIETLLRKRYDKPDLVLSDYYDLMGGTSTGAIMATGLALGMEVKNHSVVFRFGEVIFGKRSYSIIPRDWTGFRAIFKENYNSENLEKQLQSTFGEIVFGDTQAIKWIGYQYQTSRHL